MLASDDSVFLLKDSVRSVYIQDMVFKVSHVSSLDSSIIEDVLGKPYIGPFSHKNIMISFGKLLGINKQEKTYAQIQDIFKRFLFLLNAHNVLFDPDQSEISYRENFVKILLIS
ncbi:hypothetical protein RIR_jg41418.t1 [Rhizophagus irregularis DAOM 181602=DAOM 197198]|nr:hypothetical protein RIR_jg41418.t1 [Rhizophagus irregularis DAOM 181602=DAOM 197198]